MHIGEFINQYLSKKNISQRQFAKDCGLSNGYISMLIKNVNPKTGKPLVPSLSALISIAKGMGITVDELIAQTDDINVDITLTRNLPKSTYQKDEPKKEYPPIPDGLTEDERFWVEIYRKVSPEIQDLLITMVSSFDQQSEDARQMLLRLIRAALGNPS
jgi:transcriptional regulator with XRE-family HTH domain